MKTNKLFSIYQFVLFTFVFCVLMSTSAVAQKDSILIYHPEANAKEELNSAITQAKANNKHVLIMVGGNWCRWCRMFEKFKNENAKVDSSINNGFVFLHINYSKENKNLDMLSILILSTTFWLSLYF
jgi:thioredoxin-related protein